MFARYLLGDLFIHGIGGAKYDELGDAIAGEFFGIEPPSYLTLSMTLWLDLGTDPASPERLQADRAPAPRPDVQPRPAPGPSARDPRPEPRSRPSGRRSPVRPRPGRAAARPLPRDPAARTRPCSRWSRAAAALLEERGGSWRACIATRWRIIANTRSCSIREAHAPRGRSARPWRRRLGRLTGPEKKRANRPPSLRRSASPPP